MKAKRFPELKELKQLMKRKNLSYRRFSETIGISADSLNNKLNDYYSFRSDEVEKIVRILKISDENINIYFFPKCCETQQNKGVMEIKLKPKKYVWILNLKREIIVMWYLLSLYI